MLSEDQNNERSALFLPASDVMLSSAGCIDEICVPLKKLGIDIFCYTRVYQDGSMLCLSNYSDVVEMTFYDDSTELYVFASPAVSPEMLTCQYFFAHCQSSSNPLLSAMGNGFDVSHVITLVQKSHKYTEFFSFYSKQYEKVVIFCLNSVGVLEDFVCFFKKQAEGIITAHDQDRLFQIISQELKKQNADFLEYYQKEMLSNYQELRHTFCNAVRKSYNITFQEGRVLKWCALGKSNEEIALILQISKRTVESHLMNAKRKLNCFKQTDLVRKVLSLRIVD